ncbi:MAG: aminotransferase class I/II-fold pyridoxal phosphate-dependent enzyme [candidate division WOR-3 bacterium]
MRDAFASRLSRIPPYLFGELDELRATVRSGLIDLSEGSPDLAPPKSVVGALVRALKVQENHRYPGYSGKLTCRRAVAQWYRRRFKVALDPQKEVTMLIGSKEGAAHLIWAVCGEGDTVAVCDPNYPVYPNQTRLAGAVPLTVPLEEKNGFLPDLGWLERSASRLKLLCLNFPNNPTAAVAPLVFYRQVVALALKHGFYVVNDNVYSELSFSKVRPPSILEVPGALDCCLELHSLSKTFSLAGWRIGFAVGNRRLIQALLKIKQNVDSGPFGAIQDAAAFALRHASSLTAPVRREYQRRRDVFCAGLQQAGWPVTVPEATFYVWARLPEGFVERQRGSRSYALTLELLKRCRVMAAPGSGFGRHGEGFIRFALVAPVPKLREAALRVGRWLKTAGLAG